MSESILDRLDREHGGARQYLATLIVVGGATRERAAEALARKYDIPAPTGRSITSWKNDDPELRDLIKQMEDAKRDLAPGDDPADLIRPEVNRGRAVADLFAVCEQFPAFARLMHREHDRLKSAPDDAAGSDWGLPDEDTDDGEGLAASNEAFAALRESDGMTDEEFEADCVRRLGDYEETHVPTPGAGALA
jgi:hypothetical protein